MLIIMEGGDGSGKSTQAKELANRCGFKYVDKPISEFFYDKFGRDAKTWSDAAKRFAIEHAEEFPDLEKSFEGLFLTASYDNELSHLQRALTTLSYLEYVANKYKDQNVVITRGFLSSYMWNGGQETLNGQTTDPLYDAMLKLGVGVGINIVLHTSDVARHERLIRRAEETGIPIEQDEKRPFDLHPAVDFVRERGLDVIEVNTDGKSKAEVSAEIWDKLSQNQDFISLMNGEQVPIDVQSNSQTTPTE